MMSTENRNYRYKPNVNSKQKKMTTHKIYTHINFVFILIIILSGQNIFGQTDSLNNNTIYIEYLGQPGPASSYSSKNIFTSGLFTFKYDRILLKNKKSLLAANIGITYLNVYGLCSESRYGVVVTPIIVNYLFGKKKNYFGIGLIYFPYFSNYKKFESYFSLNIEDRRYFGLNNNIFLNLNIKFIEVNFETEGCYKHAIFPIPGFGIGYAFK